MTTLQLAMITFAGFATFAGCSHAGATPPERGPLGALVPFPHERYCVTKGALGPHVDRGEVRGRPVDAPTLRLYAPGTTGDAAQVTFWYRGDTAEKRALAHGEERRQLGLKLRAENGCNLVYVMWRLDPKPRLEVQVKSNPGQRSHEECGAGGYLKVKPATKAPPVPPLRIGAVHTLRAQIVGDTLTAWIDDALAWEGTLPDEARALVGPAGVRSDNLAFDLVELSAPTGPDLACKHQDGD